MDLFVICLIALLAAIVTFFSGFGLGSVLLPAFALFIPTLVAVAATAVVHLANNLLKVLLVGRKADRGVLVRFSIPAVLARAWGGRPCFPWPRKRLLSSNTSSAKVRIR